MKDACLEKVLFRASSQGEPTAPYLLLRFFMIFGDEICCISPPAVRAEWRAAVGGGVLRAGLLVAMVFIRRIAIPREADGAVGGIAMRGYNERGLYPGMGAQPCGMKLQSVLIKQTSLRRVANQENFTEASSPANR